MAKFNSLSQINKEEDYFICLIKDARFARKSKVLEIINETKFGKPKSTELLIRIYKNGKAISTNLLYAKEIGIGYTKKEARDNYGRFEFYAHPDAISTYNPTEGIYPNK